MYELPTTVDICDEKFAIRNKGDYRVIIDCMDALSDNELQPNERIISSLVIFYEKIEAVEDISLLFDTDEKIRCACEKMFEFMRCGESEDDGYKSNTKIMDWKEDEKLICSAINKVARCEIRLQPYIHWWTFMGYYMSVGESAFTTVVSIREKIQRGTKLEKWEQKFKKDNPKYFTWKADRDARKEAEDWVNSVWNKK